MTPFVFFIITIVAILAWFVIAMIILSFME